MRSGIRWSLLISLILAICTGILVPFVAGQNAQRRLYPQLYLPRLRQSTIPLGYERYYQKGRGRLRPANDLIISDRVGVSQPSMIPPIYEYALGYPDEPPSLLRIPIRERERRMPYWITSSDGPTNWPPAMRREFRGIGQPMFRPDLQLPMPVHGSSTGARYPSHVPGRRFGTLVEKKVLPLEGFPDLINIQDTPRGFNNPPWIPIDDFVPPLSESISPKGVPTAEESTVGIKPSTKETTTAEPPTISTSMQTTNQPQTNKQDLEPTTTRKSESGKTSGGPLTIDIKELPESDTYKNEPDETTDSESSKNDATTQLPVSTTTIKPNEQGQEVEFKMSLPDSSPKVMRHGEPKNLSEDFSQGIKKSKSSGHKGKRRHFNFRTRNLMLPRRVF